MAIGDPIADLLTRMRNALHNRQKDVNCLNSKVCRGIVEVLRDEGYISGFDVVEDGRQGLLRVHLKYAAGEATMHKLTRMSRPARSASVASSSARSSNTTEQAASDQHAEAGSVHRHLTQARHTGTAVRNAEARARVRMSLIAAR
jgi:ribosomal protein S8